MSHLANALKNFQKQQRTAAQSAAPPKRNRRGQKDGQPKAPRRSRQPTPLPAPKVETAPKDGEAAPLGKQIKDVLDALLASREALSVDELKKRTGHAPADGTALRRELQMNERVEITPDGLFLYKSKHEVRSKQQLMAFIRRYPEGMLMGEVRDAYPTVAADVDLLRQEGGLWALPHHDGNDLVLYPREDPPVITVSPDVAALWHEVELPNDGDAFDAELRRQGIQPIQRRGPRKRMAKPPKEKAKRQRFQIRKITNAHMPELFQDATMPASID